MAACEERERLWRDYSEILIGLRQAVESLASAAGTVEFGQRFEAAQLLAERCMKLHEVFRSHLVRHGCHVSTPPNIDELKPQTASVEEADRGEPCKRDQPKR